jgi:hypothetical protein
MRRSAAFDVGPLENAAPHRSRISREWKESGEYQRKLSVSSENKAVFVVPSIGRRRPRVGATAHKDAAEFVNR